MHAESFYTHTTVNMFGATPKEEERILDCLKKVFPVVALAGTEMESI